MNTELKRYFERLRGKMEGGRLNGHDRFNYIVGNTSGDLDSIVSAISYSRLLNILGFPVNFRTGSDAKYGDHIPILNFNEKNVKLKFSLIELLDHFSEKSTNGDSVGVSDIPFIYINDVMAGLSDGARCMLDSKNTPDGKGPYITLVDHNTLDASQKILQNNVVSIVDHHDDDYSTKSIFRLSEGTKIGSCSTLIGKLWMDYHSDGKLSFNDLIESRCYLLMLIGAILKDTSNFDKSSLGSRWCSLDFQVYNWLSSVAGITDKECRDLYENKLENSNRNADLLFRNDLSSLLDMDYKFYPYNGVNAGYSSFEIDISSIINHYGANKFQEGTLEHMESKDLDLYILLSTSLLRNDNIGLFSEPEKKKCDSKEPTVVKQMMMCSKRPYLLDIISSNIGQLIGLKEIKLDDHAYESEVQSALFSVGDVSHCSRKRIEPLIKDLINKRFSQ